MNSIRAQRTKQKMTQQELAHATGIERATLSRYETGKREPPLSAAAKIASALNISIDDLIIREEAAS